MAISRSGRSCSDGFNAIGDRFERRDAHRPLLARFQQSANQLLSVESLTPPVLLHDHVRNFIDPFVAGETPAAFEALAPAADGFAFLALARVDDLVAEMTAIRTLHS